MMCYLYALTNTSEEQAEDQESKQEVEATTTRYLSFLEDTSEVQDKDQQSKQDFEAEIVYLQ